MKNIKISNFEKVSSGDSADAKVVVMKKDAMMITIEHYNYVKKRCLELEKMVKELSGEEGVLVHKKSLKTIEVEIEHLRKNLAPMAEGKDVDKSVVDHTNTPRKRRSSQSDQPPSKTIA